MKITIEPTDIMIRVDGTLVRVWQGETESGTKIVAHVAMVGCALDADASELEAALKETVAPRPEILRAYSAFDARKLGD